MLKITELSDKLALSRNNDNESAPSRNNNRKPALERNKNNGEINRFGIDSDGMEYAKILGKLKGQKLAKSQILSKSRKSQDKKSKKLSKIGNSPNFDDKENGPNFLTPSAKEVFNHL